jgi:uncharacterized protein YdhG (YjbR/CyaY superfamily)
MEFIFGQVGQNGRERVIKSRKLKLRLLIKRSNMKLEKHEVEKYFDDAPESHKKALRLMRQIIKKAIPEAEEYISYQVPVYSLRGKRIISLGYGKDYLSLYLMSFKLAKDFAEKLGIKENGTTLHFEINKDLPEEVIIEIVRTRINEVGNRN